MQQPDSSNHYFEMAAQFVNHTAQSLFLTGKAGSGKTTFLHYIKKNSFKKLAVLAPTGVAAINAGGSTLHSFFQLPFGSFMPEPGSGMEGASSQFYNRQSLLKQLRLSKAKRALIQELELVVIDEVSMVRADLLDAIDAVLRHIRKQPQLPFGGVQMLYIGDLSQLPPVVKDQEWKVLGKFYQSPFFFHAQALQDHPPLYLELKKIYRQSDHNFIRILNNIRHNQVQAEDLLLLNQYYKPGFTPEKKGEYITLTTHNTKANHINKAELQKLKGKIHTFKAGLEGEFSEKSYPADSLLQLKEEAQIMFVRNDKGETRRYYNGKIGTVKKIKGEKIYITFPDEQEELLLEKETWRNVRYHYTKETDQIEEEEIGTFTQYPVRLAWAITIHKSQGLTFEKAIIDAGESFAPGQVYVALSRLTSLEGLILYSPIKAQSISTDEQANAFSKSELRAEVLGEQLKEAQKKYIHTLLFQAFDWEKLGSTFNIFLSDFDSRKIPMQQEAEVLIKELHQKVLAQQAIADKFVRQLEQMIAVTAHTGYTQVHERVEAAARYFEEMIMNELHNPLKKHLEVVKKKPRVKKYLKELEEVLLSLNAKTERLKQVKQFTAGLVKGTDPAELLQKGQVTKKEKVLEKGISQKPSPKEKSDKPAKGESQRISLAMFREGKSVEEIALERDLVTGTIESHLLSFIPSGEVQVHELVEEEKISLILKAMEALGEDAGASQIKAVLSEDISYGDIKAVFLHQKKLKEHN